ncbi:MAG: J domain-containing protein [Phycisphaerales bacterium]|nr:MAG: J domain-containing protein [Phycisphaerales bacterium]
MNDNQTPFCQDASGDDPRRRHERHSVDTVSWEYGSVLDLNSLGMRLSCRRKPPLKAGQHGRFKLSIPNGTLIVVGRAAWVRRIGLRRFEMGVEFVEVSPNLAKGLDALARFGFLHVNAGASRSRARRRKPQVRAQIALPDYYSILGVPPDASDDQIREAFRAYADRHHPEVSSNPTEAARFRQAQEAYEILKNPSSRVDYDRRMAG